ncbi:hypothetical protein [Caballeronia hypogeia]|uniref:hypothetical protein n=1 Tax=Caballeronia hypogeia TaxID=1777140 RepID=UPI000ABA75FC|nr:hypothetical protein [Caballeronia hypogeia]
MQTLARAAGVRRRPRSVAGFNIPEAIQRERSALRNERVKRGFPSSSNRQWH